MAQHQPKRWKILCVGSNFIKKAENVYAPIEGEFLSIVRALLKASFIVLGSSDLMVVTDHKHLLKILGSHCLIDTYKP